LSAPGSLAGTHTARPEDLNAHPAAAPWVGSVGRRCGEILAGEVLDATKPGAALLGA
jgi:hypothetical protein